jgi:hypothetical protein
MYDIIARLYPDRNMEGDPKIVVIQCELRIPPTSIVLHDEEFGLDVRYAVRHSEIPPVTAYDNTPIGNYYFKEVV